MAARTRRTCRLTPTALVTVFMVQHTDWRNGEGGKVLPTFQQAAIRAFGITPSRTSGDDSRNEGERATGVQTAESQYADRGREGGWLEARVRWPDTQGLARQCADRPQPRKRQQVGRTMGRRERRHRRQPGHSGQRRHLPHRRTVRQLRGRAGDEQRFRPGQRAVPPLRRKGYVLPGDDRLSRRRQLDGALRRRTPRGQAERRGTSPFWTGPTTSNS